MGDHKLKKGDRIYWEGEVFIVDGPTRPAEAEVCDECRSNGPRASCDCARETCAGCENEAENMVPMLDERGEKFLWCEDCFAEALAGATCPNPDCFNLNEGRPEPVSLSADGTCANCGQNK